MSERPVTTDALETLGNVISPAEKRDAIHIAVEPVKSYGVLKPGDHVGRLPCGRYGPSDKPVGIVDPFLDVFLKRDDMFWLLVYPRQIKSLRHVWSHPAFPDEIALNEEDVHEVKLDLPERGELINPPTPPASSINYSVDESMVFIEDIASKCGVSYDRLFDVLKELADGGWGYISMGENERYKDYYESFEEDAPLWDHFENVSGLHIPKDNRNMPFSCSC